VLDLFGPPSRPEPDDEPDSWDWSSGPLSTVRGLYDWIRDEPEPEPVAEPAAPLEPEPLPEPEPAPAAYFPSPEEADALWAEQAEPARFPSLPGVEIEAEPVEGETVPYEALPLSSSAEQADASTWDEVWRNVDTWRESLFGQAPEPEGGYGVADSGPTYTDPFAAGAEPIPALPGPEAFVETAAPEETVPLEALPAPESYAPQPPPPLSEEEPLGGYVPGLMALGPSVANLGATARQALLPEQPTAQQAPEQEGGSWWEAIWRSHPEVSPSPSRVVAQAMGDPSPAPTDEGAIIDAWKAIQMNLGPVLKAVGGPSLEALKAFWKSQNITTPIAYEALFRPSSPELQSPADIDPTVGWSSTASFDKQARALDERAGRFMLATSEQWDKVRREVLDPSVEDARRGVVGNEATMRFLERLSQLGDREGERMAPIKEEMGFVEQAALDFVGAPQLNILPIGQVLEATLPFAKPLISPLTRAMEKAIDAPFNTLANAAAKLPQTASSAATLQAYEGLRHFGLALATGADEVVAKTAEGAPEALSMLAERLSKARPGTRAFGALTQNEQVLANWMERTPGMREAVLNRLNYYGQQGVAPSAEGIIGILKPMQKAAFDRERALRDESWTRTAPVISQTIKVAEFVGKPFDMLLNGLGRNLATLNLISPGYVFGNIAENVARSQLAGVGFWPSSADGYAKTFGIFMGHLDPSLLAEPGKSSLYGSLKANWVDQVGGPLKAFFDFNAEKEVTFRRHALVEMAHRALDEQVRSGRMPKEIRAIWDEIGETIPRLMAGMPPGHVDATVKTARAAALSGPSALQGFGAQMRAGAFDASALEQTVRAAHLPPSVEKQMLGILQVPTRDAAEELIARAKTQLDHELGTVADGRSEWFERGILQGFRDDVENALARGISDVEVRQMLGATAMLARRAAEHAENVVGARMLTEYYRGTTAPQRRYIARHAYDEAQKQMQRFVFDYLDPVLEKLRPHVDRLELAQGRSALSVDTWKQLLGKQMDALSDLTERYNRVFEEATTNGTKVRTKLSNGRERDDLMLPNGLNLMEALQAEKGAWLTATKAPLDKLARDLETAGLARAQVRAAANQSPPTMSVYQSPLKRGRSLADQALAQFENPNVPNDLVSQSLAGQAQVKSRTLISPKESNLLRALEAARHDFDDLAQTVIRMAEKTQTNMPEMARYVDDLVRRAEALPADVRTPATWAIPRAARDAMDHYRLTFPNYERTSALTAFATTFDPFFRYQANRWPYLARTAMRYPIMAQMMEDYWNESDNGYVTLPEFGMLASLPHPVARAFAEGEFQWNPVASTVLGGVRGPLRPDFPPTNPTEEAAYKAATDLSDMTETERKWMKIPVLRDLVILSRMGKAWDAAVKASPDSPPSVAGMTGMNVIARQTSEKYGFYGNPIVTGLLDWTLSGEGGETFMSPLVSTVLNAAATTDSTPGWIARAAMQNPLLRSTFQEYQVRQQLADWGIRESEATPDQRKAAAQEVAARQLWIENSPLGGFRFRSDERVAYDKARVEALDRALDDAQRAQLLSMTGARDIPAAVAWLRSFGLEPEDALGKNPTLSPEDRARLAIRPEQRKALGELPGAEARTEASEPFRSEADKRMAEYFRFRESMDADLEQAMKQRLQFVRARFSLREARPGEQVDPKNVYTDPDGKAWVKDRPYTSSDYLRDYYKLRASAAESAEQVLANMKRFEGVEKSLDELDAERHFSYADKLAREYHALADDPSVSNAAGELDVRRLRKLQDALLGRERAEAERAGEAWRLENIERFKQEADARVDRFAPGLAHARKLDEALRTTVPKYGGVPADSERQDRLDQAAGLLADYYRSYGGPRGRKQMLDTYGREMLRDALIAGRSRNKRYTFERRKIIQSDPAYRTWFGIADPADLIAQQNAIEGTGAP
jgi:hypothetical protein